MPLPVTGAPAVIDRGVWYAGGLRFECTQCGNCCSGAPGYVWVTVEDMHRMAAYLELPFDQFTSRFVRRIGERYALTEKANYDCSFLTRDGGGKTGCALYGARPMQCRTWPFWNDNLKTPAAWRRAAGRCPGMNDADAPQYDLEHIETCRQHPESP